VVAQEVIELAQEQQAAAVLQNLLYFFLQAQVLQLQLERAVLEQPVMVTEQMAALPYYLQSPQQVVVAVHQAQDQIQYHL
jgi:hypothetical protein